jgi:predicted CoA-binding protein
MAEDFMAQKRLAVVGVSGSGPATGNAIFKALKKQGYTVYPVNPNAETAEGETCYPSVTALPEKVDGVLIVTRPDVTEQVMRDCVEAGIPRVWTHYNPMAGAGNSSASDTATAYGRENGLTVIDTGCPMMFIDFPHKCMRWILSAMGRLP